MTIEAVIFDLGGTLLHYHDKQATDLQRHFRRVTMEGVAAFAASLAEIGYELPTRHVFQQVIDRHIGESYRNNYQELRGDSIENPLRAGLAEFGINVSNTHWATAREMFYREIDRIVEIREGVHSTLETLRDMGYALGLISNTYWAADLHDRHLAEHNLLKFFEVRIYSCDVPHIKPHPSIFQMALEAMAVTPERAVYIGDRPEIDVVGAQSAGMRGILIQSPYRTEGLGQVAPDAVIDELPDLIAALRTLGEQAS